MTSAVDAGRQAPTADAGRAAQVLAGHVEVSPGYRRVAAAIVVLGSLSSILSATVANVAVPALQQIFGASLTQVQWVLTGYQLGLAAVIPVSGFMSDRFGAKRVYMSTLAIFAVASLGTGLAWNIGSLIGLRVLQGLAGGMILPVGMTMLLSMTPPTQRARLMGVVGMPMLLGPALGPTVGGWLLQVADWRWIFWVNVPTGLLAIALGSHFLRATARRRPEPVDVVGLLLATPAVTAVIFGMTQASSSGWSSGQALVPIGLGLVLLAAFVAWEPRQAHPLIDIRIFRDPGFSAAMGCNVIFASSLFGAVFLVPIYLQEVQRFDTIHAGLLVGAQGLGAALMMPISGWLTDRHGARPVVLTGVTLITAATFLLSRVGPETSQTTWVALLGIRGLGIGCAMMPAVSSAYSRLPAAAIARATAVANTLQRVAASLGVAVLATVAETRIAYHVHAGFPTAPQVVGGSLSALPPGLLVRLQAAITAGFSDTFLIAAGMAVLGLPVAVLLRRPVRSGIPDELHWRTRATALALAVFAILVCLLTLVVALAPT